VSHRADYALYAGMSAPAVEAEENLKQLIQEIESIGYHV
jgi:hypothetical protein